MLLSRRYLLIELLLCLLPSGLLQAQGQTSAFEAGGFFSGQGSGLTCLFRHADGSVGELRLVADFEGVIREHQRPGARLTYNYFLYGKDWYQSPELTVRPTFGPGLSFGYVRDKGKAPGFLAAIGADIGLEMEFRVTSVSIYAGLSADLGAHILLRGRYGSTMTLYRNGLERIWQPEIAVRYRF